MGWEIISKKRLIDKTYYMRVSKNERKDGDPMLVLVFSVELLSDIGWQMGDRMQIMIDDQDRLVGIRRCNIEGTLRLWEYAHSKDRKKKGKGRLVLRTTITDRKLQEIVGPIARTLSRSDVILDKQANMIVFEMAKA